jgi:hypothetical protein
MKNTERKNNLMPKGIPRYIRCYDNNGRSLDRYTVVYTGRYTHKTNGSFWYISMSANPFQGIGQHGESNFMPIDKPKYAHLGKKISFQELPEDCQKAVIQDYAYLWDI